MINIKGHGPIILTAPHGVYTVRNNTEIHDQEQYVNEIIDKMYELLGPNRCTTITWNKPFFERNNLYPQDPNHIKQLHKSTWNKLLKKILKKIKSRSKTVGPIFHIDLHGMTNNWYDHDDHLCIGIDGLKDNCKCIYEQLFPQLKPIFNNLHVPYSFNTPFNGYSFNHDFYTLTHQGIMNNFISLQFEISNSLRKKLYEEATMRDRLKIILLEMYSLNKEIVKSPKYKLCKKQQTRKKKKTKNNKIIKKSKTTKVFKNKSSKTAKNPKKK